MSDKSMRATCPPATSSAEASPAKTSAMLEHGSASKDRAPVCGQSMRASLASYDHDSSLWRTSQRCVFGGWVAYSGTWPRAGMMRSGTAYQLKPSARIIGETGSLSWPTPTVNGNYNRASYAGTSGDGLSTAVGPGPLSPTWVEWLMGFPLGWTDLGASATP